jgi:CarD family transcriptional regulator
MTFQVGERVVYPNHGVAVVENISSRAFAGHHERFYLLKLPSNSMTVMVPFSHVGGLRLRKVTRNGEMARVVQFLADGRCEHYGDWKDRFKQNTEKMAEGSLLGVAEVLKCLLEQRAVKILSFREKKMLDRARHMLITELSTSRGMSEGEAAEILEKALAKAGLHFPEAM